MKDTHNSEIPKQYLAAHFYLLSERPMAISEAQRAQLGALHLHASYGPYKESLDIPDLTNCTVAEKKKRTSEWKKLGLISKDTAMRKFIDLISNLFPNWVRFHKLRHDFEAKWVSISDAGFIKRPEPIRLKTIKKTNKSFESAQAGSLGLTEINKNKKSNFRKPPERFSESPQFVYKKEISQTLARNQVPKIPNSYMQRQQNDEEFLKKFIESMQSHRGGDIRKTSVTRLPKGMIMPSTPNVKYNVPQLNFDIQMQTYRKKLLTQEFARIKEKPENDKKAYQNIIPNIKDKINNMKTTLDQMEKDINSLDSRIYWL